MRCSFRSPLLLSVVAVLGLGLPARGQVSVNMDALNPPASAPAQGATPGATTHSRPVARPAAQRARSTGQTQGQNPGQTAPGSGAGASGAAAGSSATTAGSGTGSANGQTQATPTANPRATGGVAATRAGANRATGTASPGAAGAAAAGAAVTGAAATGAAALALPEPPPATPVLPTPTPIAVAPAPPPVRPATSATAGSSTAVTQDGLRIIFAAGKSELTPESAATLTEFAKKTPSGETVSFNVMAYATGTPEDPSTARRLALARALTIRGAMMADGVASTRIYVRANGAPGGVDAGPADRVDISVLGGPAVHAGAPATNPATTTPAGTPAPPLARP